VLGPKDAEIRIIGCDLHARQQTVATLDTTAGELVKMTLKHEGHKVREFYSTLQGRPRVGIEASGSMQWFVNLMEELGIECRVGHPAEIRAAEHVALAARASDLMQRLSRLPKAPYVLLLRRRKPGTFPLGHRHHLWREPVLDGVASTS
jgi:hypothetical protein